MFTGPACLQCNMENNYISSGKVAQCNTCYSKNILIVYAVFLLLASIGYQLLMIFITYKDNKSIYQQYTEGKLGTSEVKAGQFMVIFSSFSQMTSIFSTMNAGTVESLLGISNTVGNSNTQVMFSLQCLYIVFTGDSFKGLQF